MTLRRSPVVVVRRFKVRLDMSLVMTPTSVLLTTVHVAAAECRNLSGHMWLYQARESADDGHYVSIGT